MDFTLEIYKRLLQTLQEAGYRFITFAQYMEGAEAERMVVLRHDVDKRPANSLQTALEEQKLGISASYYFRAVAESWDEGIIRQIAALGHEVGYHYESLTTCDGDMEKAYDDFCRNLDALRQLTEVKTICMHGSPQSRHDSRDLWKRYDYRKLEIMGEPYFDVDFSKLFYMTDTGRRWDGFRVSVRDRMPKYQELWERNKWVYHNTKDIIDAILDGSLPPRFMMTTHPQRWTDNKTQWATELLTQNAKNIVKRMIVKRKEKQ